MTSVPDAAIRQLAQSGAASVPELLRAVRAAGGAGVSRAALERALAADPRVETDPDAASNRPRWRLVDVVEGGALDGSSVVGGAGARAGGDGHGARTRAAAVDGPASVEGAGSGDAARRQTRARLADLDLRPWQVRALAAWSPTCRGVVEAVTGTGKTRLALAAVRSVVDAGGRAMVLVPTIELLEQWVREVRAALPDASVGRLGGGGDDDLFDCEILVATPQSASAVPVELPPRTVGLLVADEAHRYGAPSWGAALREEFSLRLALTATYERGDDGVAEVLEPYFGEVVYRYRYAEAAADGTIAPFRIALAGIRLTAGEAAAHAAADARVRQLHRELIGPLGMPKEPRALFAAAAAVVAEAEHGGGAGHQVRACREYLSRVRERRDIAAGATGKLAVCRAVAPALHGRRSLVFTDTIDQAEAATATLAGAGIGAEIIHGGLSGDRRRIRLAQFRRGRIDALVAPRVLDEGVDVPAADTAVVLAAFRTRRHLVQRLGRVLRQTESGSEARLILAHARGTAEDPDHGGHEAFLQEVAPVARSVDAVDVDRNPTRLAAWLSQPG